MKNMSMKMLAMLVIAYLPALMLVAFTAKPAKAAPAPYMAPPCRYEDGSTQFRCVWDARHMGNGRGDSYLMIHGGTGHAIQVTITHRRAHRLIARWEDSKVVAR